jgi:hypothetical protein
MMEDEIIPRKNELLTKAYTIIERIKALSGSNALTETETLATAVHHGIMKVPQIMKAAL